MKAAVVVLNWNTKDYLRAFLPAVVHSCAGLGSNTDGTPVAEVIVADSGSTDGSIEVLAQEFPQVRVILLNNNYGFTGGYNRALEAVKDDGFDYYILLNSDIEVDDGWLEPLLEWMESHPECGICGPKLRGLLSGSTPGTYTRSERFEYAGAAGGLLDYFGFPYCRGRVWKHVEKDCGQYDHSHPDVLWVTGACLVIRSSLWNYLGGLDDRFFAHMEEIDLCWRAQLAGWKVNVVPQSVVWHLGGGTLPPTSPFKLKLNFRNNLLALEKNLACTYLTWGLSQEQAKCRAANFMRVRIFLDFCAGIVYFCIGKPKLAKAVREAHKEWKLLRTRMPEIMPPVPGATVAGLTHKLIFFN